jgi:DNA-directed RNA polymerase specialized sigma24 family protein
MGENARSAPNLSTVIAPHLPYLRRFARALCGSQSSGDAFVASTLEAVIEDRSTIDLSFPPRVALYRLFYSIWSSVRVDGVDTADDLETDVAVLGTAQVARLTPQSRRLLLLTSIEEFALDEAAAVMGISAEEAETMLQHARDELARERRARVMIIEDEPIIAVDIESIVLGMGHEVVGIADTRRTAVTLAGETEPDLVLADVQLADGSSGIKAVEEILGAMSVPVVFITAYPERLLTGDRPEPTYLVTKPFRPESVEAAIAQALFHNARDA